MAAGKLSIVAYDVTIAAAATAQTIATSTQVDASEVILRAKASNVSDAMLLGNRSGQSWPLLKADQPMRLSEILNRMGYGDKFDLKEIFVKAGNNGDIVQVLLINRD